MVVNRPFSAFFLEGATGWSDWRALIALISSSVVRALGARTVLSLYLLPSGVSFHEAVGRMTAVHRLSLATVSDSGGYHNGMGMVGLDRYEPTLLPPNIRYLVSLDVLCTVR